MYVNDPSQALAFLESKQREARWRGLPALKEAVASPSAANWNAIVAALVKFPKEAAQALVTWLTHALEGWPVDLRRLPRAFQPRGKKTSPFAGLARLTLLSSAESWFEDEFTREGTVRAWGASGKDVFVRATGLDPHRAGGKVELLDGDGKVTFTLVNDGEYGEGRGAVFRQDARRAFTVYDISEGLLVVESDTTTGKRIWETTLKVSDLDNEEWEDDGVAQVELDPKEQWLAVLHGDRQRVLVLRTKNGKLHREIACKVPVTALAVSSSALFVATAEGLSGYPLTTGDGAAGGPKARGKKSATEKNHEPIPLDDLGTVLRLYFPEDSLLEAVTTQGRFRWKTTDARPILPAETLETWNASPIGAEIVVDQVALHPTLGMVYSSWSTGALRIVVARTGRAFEFSGECVWASPLPDGLEWLVVERVPDPDPPSEDHEDEDEDEDAVDEGEGGIYLFTPDGVWQPKANKVRARPNPLEAACSRHQCLSGVLHDESLEAARYALERHKWDVNGEDYNNSTRFHLPLHNTAQLVSEAYKADDPIFQKLALLLDHGADVTRVDESGANALHALFYEAAWEHRECSCPEALEAVALRLLEGGCDPWQELGSGVYLEEGPSTAPARMFAKLGFLRCLERLPELRGGLLVQAVIHGRWNVVDHLVSRGLSLSALDEVTSTTALHHAVRDPEKGLLVELLERGIDTEAPMGDGPYTVMGLLGEPGTWSGFTALHLAAYCGKVQAVITLLDRGANHEAKTTRGWTPAHLAAEWGHIPVLQALFRQGAEPNAHTSAGESPLDLASANRSAQYPTNNPAHDAQRDRTAVWLTRYLESTGADAREALLSELDRAAWEQFLLDYEGGKRTFDKLDLRSGRLERRSFTGVHAICAQTSSLEASNSTWEDSTLQFVGPCKLYRARFYRCEFPDMSRFKAELMDNEFVDCDFISWQWPADIGWKTIERCRFRAFLGNGWPSGGGTLTDCRFEDFRFEGPLSFATFTSCVFVSGTFVEARRYVKFQSCSFTNVDFSATKFGTDTSFHGCRYDTTTRFPEGFDPKANGLEPAP